MIRLSHLATWIDLCLHARKSANQSASTATSYTCSADGAPPMQTVEPVTIKPHVKNGRLLSFQQAGVTRYACLNLPRQAEAEGGDGRTWPLLIYLHGSRTMPDSLYTLGKHLVELQHTWSLSTNPSVRGFILLSPEGRRATPFQSPTGTGFHWDEWYRNSTANVDAQAIDHFLDEVIATGKVDTRQIYVFGWSNGAYMATLYGVWRSHRIAAIAQYAGGDPWSREPCPVPLTAARQVPLVLLRNLCDALVPYDTTQPWIETLRKRDWPFAYHNLDLTGQITSPDRTCRGRCSRARGVFEHVRWPNKASLEEMLRFLKQHPLG